MDKYDITEINNQLNNKSKKEIKMQYKAEVSIKFSIIVDAEDEETAAEIAESTVSDAYDDCDYEIVTITRLE